MDFFSCFSVYRRRGLGASRDLNEGELILRVPKSALMSLSSAKEDRQLAKALSGHSKLSSAQILAVHLLKEVAKGNLSSWYAYLVKLPRHHHVLAHFPQSAVQALQVEDAIRVANNTEKEVTMDWEAAKELMVEIQLPRRLRSLKAWFWASATISSRTLHVPWDDAGTLCPVGDLFNYSPPGELYLNVNDERNQRSVAGHGAVESSEGQRNLYSEDDDFSCGGVTFRERLRDGGYELEYEEYCFYARRAYKAGEQVLLCYGQYNNLELLEHYGFSMRQNPNDYVQLGLPDDSTELRSSSVGSTTRVTSNGLTYIGVDGAPSFSLLAGLRVQAIHPSERKAKAHIALMGKQISKESDILVYQWLWRKCESLLASLPTSLEDDRAMAELLGSSQDMGTLRALCKSLVDGTQRYFISSQIGAERALGKDEVLRDLENLLTQSKGGLESYRQMHEAAIGRSEEDIFLIETWKLALEWRMGYKSILHRCCSLCAKRMALLT